MFSEHFFCLFVDSPLFSAFSVFFICNSNHVLCLPTLLCFSEHFANDVYNFQIINNFRFSNVRRSLALCIDVCDLVDLFDSSEWMMEIKSAFLNSLTSIWWSVWLHSEIELKIVKHVKTWAKENFRNFKQPNCLFPETKFFY